jgi:xylulokinase
MSCYVGVDFGTSGARAIAINATAEICGQVSERFQDLPADQWASHWQAVLWRLMQQLPTDVRSQTSAIAINGTSSTVLLCDRTGHPLTAPLLYHDASGATELPHLATILENVRDTGRANVLSATSSLVKLLWWQRQSYFAEARFFLHQADWLALLLHGQLGISDYHNALKVGYDVVQLRYPDWLTALDIAPLLPKVMPPGAAIAPIQSHVATELGFSPDCLIHAGTTDSIAAFLASGAIAPGEAVTSLGSTLVLKLLSEAPVDDPQYGIYSHRLGHLWLVGGASNTGGAVLQQFFTAAELTQLSQQIPVHRSSPLHYYPLNRPGERFPVNDPNLPPQLEPRPDRPVAFLHGLLEGMARIEAQGYQRLQELGATALSKVYTAGGGAHNPAWTAIRDRYLPVPVMPSQQTEAAYGTALLAMQHFSHLFKNG